MNKFEEALSRIEESYYNLDNSMSASSRFNKDLHLLAGLIDKETPKKPVVIQDDIFGDYHLVCPNCGQGAIVIATRTDGKLYPRCPFCGQKLKEGDEDEK